MVDADVEVEPAFETPPLRQSVLIIDDDQGQVEVLSHRLHRQGFETFAAYCGKSGLQMARTRHPQLVLLDLRLPDVDGFQVCERLADDPQTCDIPIIMLSGMVRPDIIRSARAAGCHYYVRKPYDPNALLVLIKSALGEQERW
jgi:two-component system, OmpR family, alkaline phosphatase synthesis response regulator PhoP